MTSTRTPRTCVSIVAGLLAAGTIISSSQSVIEPAAWQFRHSTTSLAGSWDIWHPQTGKIGASLYLNDHASPPEGRIVEIVTFDNNADIIEIVVLDLSGIDATGMTVRLERENVSSNLEARQAYRDNFFYNATAVPDPTDRRLMAISAAQNDKNRKTVNTFRLPSPPTLYELRTGLLLPDLKLRLTANGATVAATMVLPER